MYADAHQIFIQSHFNYHQKMQTEYDYYIDLYVRKYSVDFSSEMKRSVKVMLDSFDKS